MSDGEPVFGLVYRSPSDRDPFRIRLALTLSRRAGRLPRPLAVVALIEIEINCLHEPFPRSVVGLFP